jgi:hypothetical protein
LTIAGKTLRPQVLLLTVIRATPLRNLKYFKLKIPITMGYNGRYMERPVQLRNGFYIEVCNKGAKKGMKIRSENKKDMEDAAARYGGYMDVTILGEYKAGVPFVEIS